MTRPVDAAPVKGQREAAELRELAEALGAEATNNREYALHLLARAERSESLVAIIDRRLGFGQ